MVEAKVSNPQTPLPLKRNSSASGGLLALEAYVRQTSSALGESFRAVLADLGPRGRRPVDLVRSLKVNQVLAGKIHRTLKHSDPMALAHEAPGPEALHILLRAAADAGIGEEVRARAQAAAEAWDQLLATVGGRAALHAMLTAWIPGTRRGFELANRQAAFKANSALKGILADANFAAVALHPCGREGHLDFVALGGYVGLRRLRPGALLQVNFGLAGSANAPTMETLDGRPIGPIGPSTLLSDFSSDVPVRAEVDRPGESVRYVLDDDDFGLGASADLAFGFCSPGSVPALPLPGRDNRTSATGNRAAVPCQLLVLDVYLHDDVFPGAVPRARAYDMVPRGEVHPREITRDIEVDLLDAPEHLGRGTAAIGTLEAPRFADLFRHACELRSWDPESFRGFRLRVRYPLYGHKYLLDFHTP